MSFPESGLTPGFIDARELYRENLRDAFKKFGFTAVALDEIMKSGCSPAIEDQQTAETIQPLSPRLSTFFFESLYMRPWSADKAGANRCLLSFNYMNFDVWPLKTSKTPLGERIHPTQEPYNHLYFDLETGLYLPKYIGPQSSTKQFPIPDRIMTELATLPATIVERETAVALSIKPEGE